MGDYDEWIHIRGELDLINDTYNVYPNGLQVGRNLGIHPGQSVSDIEELFLGKGFAVFGPAYSDNVKVQAIPEPATLSLLALGACLTLLRRSEIRCGGRR